MNPSLVGLKTRLLLTLCALEAPDGAIVEVGVYKGGTAWWLALTGRPLYLYDTFTGHPHADPKVDKHGIGEFQDTGIERITETIPTAKVIEGIFPQSAVEMPPIAFAHIDCDQYQSIVESVKYLWPRMVKGGIMWFDDSPCLKGARKALEDLFPKDSILLNSAGKNYVIKQPYIKLSS